jgi:peroxiredoxin
MLATRKHCFLGLFSILLVMTTAFGSDRLPAKFNRKVNVGDPAPVWKDLPGIDGQAHSLADYKAADVLVVLFTCNHCPVARMYTDRLVEFTRTYAKREVSVVAVNCSRFPTEGIENMRKRAEEEGFNFVYLYDSTQQTGRDYGATVTPQLFVLDKQRRIAYMGAFDDNRKVAKVRRHYARDAVEAQLSGKAPEIGETRPFGCRIEYKTE